jgi:hypothetical protein
MNGTKNLANTKILSKSLTALVFCLVLLLSGCSKDDKASSRSTQTKPFRFYLVTAPINKEQAELARLFLVNAANPDSEANAQIILPTNSYTIAELCDNENIGFPTSEQKVSNDSDIQAVVNNPKDSIEKRVKDNSCKATPKVLTKIVENLKNASKRGEKLIIVMQIPWEAKDISPPILDNFKKGLEEVAGSNNIEKVMLFGVSPEGSDRLNSAFEAFNQKEKMKIFMGSTNDLPQMLQKMKEIRSDVLKRK